MENVKNAPTCHDCQKKIKTEEETITNGFLLKYKRGDEEIKVFKCSECYQKNKSLKKFQKTEVYSRVVGYLRPVKQWNEGKQQEYKDRKEYVNN